MVKFGISDYSLIKAMLLKLRCVGRRKCICYIHLYTDLNYRKTSYISRTLVGNKIVDNSDVVGASPVGAAPTTSSFST